MQEDIISQDAGNSSSNNRFKQFFIDMRDNMGQICSSVQSEIASDADRKFRAILKDNSNLISEVNESIMGVLVNNPTTASSDLSEWSADAVQKKLSTYLKSSDDERLNHVMSLVNEVSHVHLRTSEEVGPNKAMTQKALSSLKSTYRNMYAASCGKIALCKLGLGLLKATSPVYVALKNSLLTLLSAAKLIASTVATMITIIPPSIALGIYKATRDSDVHTAMLSLAKPFTAAARSMMNSYQNIHDIVTLQSSDHDWDEQPPVLERMGIKAVKVQNHDYVGELVRDFSSAVDMANTGFQSAAETAKDGLQAAHSLFHKNEPSSEVTGQDRQALDEDKFVSTVSTYRNDS